MGLADLLTCLLRGGLARYSPHCLAVPLSFKIVVIVLLCIQPTSVPSSTVFYIYCLFSPVPLVMKLTLIDIFWTSLSWRLLFYLYP